MNYELIINSSSTEVTIALLSNKKLIELHKDKHDTSFNVGDIYLGKVRKIVPSLNAAFVDVGYEKDAFLHYHDLGPKVLTLLKFIKSVSTGRLKDYSLKEIYNNSVTNDFLQKVKNFIFIFKR